MEFKPYKDNEYLENSYYKIPQELFVSSLYKDKLNSDSKIFTRQIITISKKSLDRWRKKYIFNFYKRRSTGKIEFIW
mgnify:CR=1 FL=1